MSIDRQQTLQQQLEGLQSAIRKDASDADLRVHLFQLLCVMGNWKRALAQLQVCAQLAAKALPMAQTYREAIKCEVLRAEVFAGKRTPQVMGKPPEWIGSLIEALKHDASGQLDAAALLRAKALDAAEPSPFMVDKVECEWIADADSRLGPVCEVIANGQYYWLPFESCSGISLEKPVDMRDLVWLPAEIMLPNEGRVPALIPTRYVDTDKSTAPNADQLKLASATEWIEKAEGTWFGLGQRLWTSDQNDHPILDTRLLTSMVASAPTAEPAIS